MKKILKILTLILIIHASLFGQTDLKYAIVKLEGNRDYNGQKDGFHIFKNEILPRTTGVFTLPDSTTVILGSGDDMNSITKYKIFPPKLISQMVKKQSVFLKDGKLHVGYLFDLSFLNDSLNENEEIKIANNTSAVLTLKKGSKNSISEYPYDSTGLAMFYKTKNTFKDKYIRVIVPGFVSVFIGTSGIEKIPNEFDTKVYTEYQILIKYQQQTILYNKATQHCYKVDKGTFKNASKISNGTYPIVYPAKNVDKQFNIKNGKATIQIIPEWYEQYVKWIIKYLKSIIIGAILIIIIIIRFWFWSNLMTLISKIPIYKKKKEHKDSKEIKTKKITVQNNDTINSLAKEYRITCKYLKKLNKQDERFKSINNKKRLSNYKIKEILVPDQDKIGIQSSNQIIVSTKVNPSQEYNPEVLIKSVNEIKQSQSVTEKILNEIINTLKTSDSEEITKLRTSEEKLKDQSIELKKENEGLQKSFDDLTKAKDELEENLRQTLALNQRFEQQSIFIEKFAVLTNKFLGLFNNIISIENKILNLINEQNHKKVKNYIALVHSKYNQSVPSVKFQYWQNILQMLKDNDGLITDTELLKKLKSKKTNEEKVEIISWLIINEVFFQQLGALLIFIEEIRNVEEVAGDKISPRFEEMRKTKEELINEMKQGFGIEVENIKLYNKFETYTNIRPVYIETMYDTKLIDKKFAMGDILEIKTYGMKIKDKTIQTIVIAK